jgi:hypothetical protein
MTKEEAPTEGEELQAAVREAAAGQPSNYPAAENWNMRDNNYSAMSVVRQTTLPEIVPIERSLYLSPKGQ